MDEPSVIALLQEVAAGRLEPGQAAQRLKHLDVEDLGFARLDHHRILRKGFPEVIYGLGKTPEQIAVIAERIAAAGQTVLATRCDPAAFEAVRQRLPDATYHPVPRCIVAVRSRPRPVQGTIVIATGGTTDIPVAEEAALTAELTGSTVERLWDVGVAGIHRLLAHRERLFAASVVIAVAGMEGALPSVIGGLVDQPVIAVPTSVGYGAAFGGVAALLGMLTSCAPGLLVVNIDNGFGAGYAAGMINRMGAVQASGPGVVNE
ncbi:MAG TPA: nickel pincer cofactor biosynthesis protein LarB [Chloroflexota bacterium]|jgi:NCAIR mutase (PurE)-related protein|nr:nickel pincer cofactor biosynthesis protein LarB [Chloroflexota bacterium]